MNIGNTNFLFSHLNDWYLQLRDNNYHLATESKSIIDTLMISNENESALIYYSLLEYWHYLLKENKTKVIPRDYKDEILFYYHYFQGSLMFNNFRYEDASAHFNAVKRYLSKIDNELCYADFHLAVGETYFYMKKYKEAIKNIEVALPIFKDESMYDELAKGMLILFDTYQKTRDYTLAKEYIEHLYKMKNNIKNTDIVRKIAYCKENFNLNMVDSTKQNRTAVYLLKR
ncbi:hypothetical protein NSQ59_27395 [Margalitia sp. FSL K6-0131]|uniref:response regulator aspartate phosphatase n=1 Tax=Margalitia sp. FSL K6-0131 TaxID=2954604 RepID=UPI0030F715AD